MSENATHHVVMLPWSAFGHLIPFFQLSIDIAKSGIHVSFISTPKNIQRLPKAPSDLSHLLHLVEIPFPSSLDSSHLSGGEATVDIPFDKIQYLKLAWDHMQNPVKEFVSKLQPNWIICDFHAHWAVEIAQELHVKLMYFSVYSASTIVFFGPPGQMRAPTSPEDLTSPREWVNFPSSVAFQRNEAIAFYQSAYIENVTGLRDIDRVASVIDSANALSFRSCYEMEGEYLNLYQELIEKPVIPIGLLPPEMPERRLVDEFWSKTFEWLDAQATKSVVFVGFGSECKLSKEQVFEIAYGLEISELPFLWTLRKPSWAIHDHDSLPLGFCERTSKRGKVCFGWAPQKEILAHKSIGGSLFHSGWGSIIETLMFGHTLVVLPFVVDQPLNAKALVDKGLAIEVKRNNEDGSFSRDDIAKCLREAMVLEEGEKLRIKTREIAKVVGDLKLHHDYMEEFVKFLRT
ncbi:putative UDP-rhamnose:rhamnosyltransferase 1 [Arachis stenosperma]|uniref:putative UDP-rhamnose:rhamnosyltransferase 1 n=1 Tax=Arachis stenosperma TaxID=217475 RepID=UPI0025AD03EE|nr:putative UDP-rhamnose:rhamnosyltransferase 1 [Arachis stenosperma]